ncbi:class I SAM-dependent methyltransferase [Yoonia sp. 2307UL14-13]|uniref:class I SAM-dependent methyltransferase n=1 Tax=Yoonia sp. 2307UL14-13 TaxID=3126506 RepID=UPI0030B27B5C
MPQSRLATALNDGLLALPAGNICVMRPSATYDVVALPREAVQIMQGFHPDHIAWERAGYPVGQEGGAASVAIVVVPRAKALARDMIARACTNADLIIVDGQKTDGVDSLFKDCRKRLGDLSSITKGHGRLFWFDKTDAFADWAAGPPQMGPHGFYTNAGVFSDGAIDAGSTLLAEHLPAKLPARMADLGAGWGYLAGPVLERKGVISLDLIEAEALSVACARKNVTDPRATIHWADATDFTPDAAFDGIVMNPPFHTGRTPDPALGRAFIHAAARLLTPNGKLWMVANRHLPYETTLSDTFRNVDMIASTNAFKVFHANRPKR